MSKEKKCTGCKGEGGWQYETPEGVGAERCTHCEGTGIEPKDNDVEGVENIGLFDRLDNTIGNHMEGYATDEDLLKIAYEVNHYLVKQPYDNTAELEWLRKVNGELVDALEYIVNSNIRLNGILKVNKH